MFKTLKVIFVTLILALSLSANAQLHFNTDSSTEKRVTKTTSSHLSIYPNPTSDFFAVKHDSNVEKIVVYNWIGKKLESFSHYKGRIYNVKDLDTGIYIIRLFDRQNKLVKVLRLHRK